MYQSFHRTGKLRLLHALHRSARTLGVSSRIAAVLGLLYFACSGDGRPPAPGGEAGSGASAGGTIADGGEGGTSSGAGGAAGATGGDAGAAGGGLGGAGMGGSTPLRDDCTPSEACTSYCAALGPDTTCGVGDAAQCACFCEDRYGDPCPAELAAVLECISERSASGDCSTRGRVIEGCEQETIALELCDLGGREQLCARNTPVCDPYCRATTLAFCNQSSESVGECLCGCEQNVSDRCETELQAFMTCADDDPTFSCGTSGELVPGSCSSEWQTFRTCLVGDQPDAGP
jgi:hypothetical protein